MSLPTTTAGILAFERLLAERPRRDRERTVRRVFGVSVARYHLALDRALDDPRAPLFDAPLVNRLRRLREHRRAVRTVRRLA